MISRYHRQSRGTEVLPLRQVPLPLEAPSQRLVLLEKETGYGQSLALAYHLYRALREARYHYLPIDMETMECSMPKVTQARSTSLHLKRRIGLGIWIGTRIGNWIRLAVCGPGGQMPCTNICTELQPIGETKSSVLLVSCTDALGFCSVVMTYLF